MIQCARELVRAEISLPLPSSRIPKPGCHRPLRRKLTTLGTVTGVVLGAVNRSSAASFIIITNHREKRPAAGNDVVADSDFQQVGFLVLPRPSGDGTRPRRGHGGPLTHNSDLESEDCFVWESGEKKTCQTCRPPGQVGRDRTSAVIIEHVCLCGEGDRNRLQIGQVLLGVGGN
ncbi:hypothetical protein Bbelb_177360 [Branchiostoma belcheri]|nr:hypothetical protein Bbelb_177360 [Branchiostoma belcheri]